VPVLCVIIVVTICAIWWHQQSGAEATKPSWPMNSQRTASVDKLGYFEDSLIRVVPDRMKQRREGRRR
jgi:hypothetical protein